MRNRPRRNEILVRGPLAWAGGACLALALFLALVPACSSGGGGDADAVADTAAPEDATGDATPPDAGPACVSAADCAGRFPGAGPCQVATCSPDGTCSLGPASDGEACDDGLACTQVSACVGGTCVGSGAPDCADDEPCTDDACVEPGGCVHTPRTGADCDDGDPCTVGDACDAAGLCVSGAHACDPCDSDADCEPFEDGDLCNGTLACVASVCQTDPATRVSCDPSNDPPCQETVCVSATGACERRAIGDGTACEDGNACTQGDACAAGVCAEGAYVCPACATAADCAEYTPEDACLGQVVCVESECRIDPASVVVCVETGLPCSEAYCDAGDGTCKTRDVADGTGCDDGDACTEGDRCAAGVCGGSARDCDDGDACTVESCSPATGECVTAPGLPCDDGDACTTDACDPATGECIVIDTVLCDDGDACTTQACDPATGECSEPATILCDDGDACTTDACDPSTGVCAVTDTVVCDDGDACTTQACDPVTGACAVTETVSCDDDDLCTTDVCDSATGDCAVLDTVACDDDDACTADACDPATGACVFTAAVVCDDERACSVDSCDPATGECVFDDAGCVALPEDCANDVDDDRDGLVDCADDDCADASFCGDFEICDDGIDNDGNGARDCEDPRCLDDPACPGPFTCARPASLPTGEAVAGSTLGLSDFVEPACVEAGTGPDAVWSWTAPTAGVWCLDTVGSAMDTVLTVRTACDGEELACNDDVTFPLGVPSRPAARVQLTAEAGGTYLAIVGGFGTDEGDYVLAVVEGPCPALFEEDCADLVDDDADGGVDCADVDCVRDPACVSAVCEPVATVGCGEVVVGSTIGAPDLVDGYLAPCAPVLTGPEVAYTFEAESDDVLRLWLDAGEVPLQALVLDGVCAPETCIDGGWFEPTVDIVAGRTYVLVVDGTGGAAGDFTLTVSCESRDESLNCGDGVDNDGDEQVDCDDADDCGAASTCYESSCGDGVDNEGDGLTDCDDDECAETRVCAIGLACAAPGALAVPGRTAETTQGLADAVDPDCVPEGTGADAVYAWTAPEDGVLCLHTAGSAMDTVLFVRDDCLNGPDIACADDTPPLGSRSLVELDVVAGTTYFVFVGGFASAEGAYVLNAFDGSCPPFFEEVCDDEVDEDLDGQTDCADVDCSGAPTCFESNCADGVDNEGDGLTDCADDECAAAPLCREGACDDGLDNDEDGFTDCDDSDCELVYLCADGGLTCALPAVLAIPGRMTGSTTGAPDNADPICQVYTGAEVVFTWTPETDEVLCIDTNDSEFDTVLYVRLDCENGPEIACDDDGGDGRQSRLEVHQTPGVPHYLFIDGYGEEGGPFTLTTTLCP